MKKLCAALLFGTLALTACGGGSKSDGERLDTGSITVVNGTVVERDETNITSFNLTTKSWTGGAGQIVMDSVGDTTELARGNLNSNGSFSLSLPATVAASRLTPINLGAAESPNCKGNIKISDPAAKSLEGHFSVLASKTGEISPFTMESAFNESTRVGQLSINVGNLVYVDRSVSITGSQVCQPTQGITSNTKIDMHLTKGWNLVDYQFVHTDTEDAQDDSTVVTSGKLPSNNWVLMDEKAASLSGGSLKASSFFQN